VTSAGALVGGGAARIPTNAIVAAAGVGAGSANLAPGSVVPRQPTTGGPRPPTGPNVGPGLGDARSATTNANAVGNIVAAAANVAVAAAVARQTEPRALALTVTNSTSAVPFVLGSFIANGAVSVTPVLGYRVAGVNAAGVERTRFVGVGFGLDTTTNISGQITAQSSFLGALTASFLANPDTSNSVFAGGFTATTRRAVNFSAGHASGAVTSIPGTMVVDADLLPVNFQVDQNNYLRDGTIEPATAFQFAGGGAPNVNYTFTETATRASTASSLGQDRDGGTLVGWAAGTARTFSSATGTPPFTAVASTFRIGQSGSTPSPNFTVTLFPDTGTGTASMSIANLDPSGQPFTSGVWNFGRNTADPDAPVRSSYVDDQIWALRGQRASIPGSTDNVPTSTSNGATLAIERTQVVPWETIRQGAPAPTLPNNVNPVVSPYLQWGLWTADNYRSTGGAGLAVERTGLNTWVAGSLTGLAEIPASGAATFSGHAVASIRDNVRGEFVAASSFSANVNFGSNLVTVSAPNLDGLSFSGSGLIGSDRRFFSTTFNAPGGISGTALGAFYGPGAAATGGQISFANGSGSYRGAGVFMGVR
jgi:hypothetical protein